jgi:hypothetical protein
MVTVWRIDVELTRHRRNPSACHAVLVPHRVRRFVAPLAGGLALVIGAAACTADEPAQNTDPLDLTATVPNETLVPPDATLPPEGQRPQAIAEGILAEVTQTIGIELPAGASECVVGALQDRISPSRLLDFGVEGLLAEAPEALRNDAFLAVDDCVDAEVLATAGAPLLTGAGVSETKATCLFRLIRNEMGMGGLFLYSAGRDGAIDLDQRLAEQYASIIETCAVDLATLATTTTIEAVPSDDAPPPTTSSATTTSVPGSATTTTVPGPPTTRQVVSVVTNAPPVTLATTSTTTDG